MVPVGVPGSGSCLHFSDHDPVVQRPAKRFRIIGKGSAHKREPISGDGLPTPKRWKRLVPPGTEPLGMVCPLSFFLAQGLVDELA